MPLDGVVLDGQWARSGRVVMICRWKAERGDGKEAATGSTLEKSLGDTLICLRLGGKSSTRTGVVHRIKSNVCDKEDEVVKECEKEDEVAWIFLSYCVYAGCVQEFILVV